MYREVNKGRFEAALLYNDCEIAYTSGNQVITWINEYTEHYRAIEEFAWMYECEIVIREK